MILKREGALKIKLGYLLKEVDKYIKTRNSRNELFNKHVEEKLDKSVELYFNTINESFEKLVDLAKTKYNLNLVKSINRRVK